MCYLCCNEKSCQFTSIHMYNTFWYNHMTHPLCFKLAAAFPRWSSIVSRFERGHDRKTGFWTLGILARFHTFLAFLKKKALLYVERLSYGRTYKPTESPLGFLLVGRNEVPLFTALNFFCMTTYVFSESSHSCRCYVIQTRLRFTQSTRMMVWQNRLMPP